MVVVNHGIADAPTTISLSGESGATGGTATQLRGDPTAMNSLAQPKRVGPTATTLGRLGSQCRCTFPANSLTVLDLNTAGGVGAAAAPSLATSTPTTSAAAIERRAIRSGVASIRTAKVTRHPARPAR